MLGEVIVTTLDRKLQIINTITCILVFTDRGSLVSTCRLVVNSVFSSETTIYFPVAQDGDYTLTLTLKSGESQTKVVNIIRANGQPRIFFLFETHKTTVACDCFCDPPPTLSMVSGNQDCNYKMFQSCTLRYGPPPPAMRPGAPVGVFTSTESFVDPITKSSFFYYFSCQYNQFFLTRIFPTSPFGSPYRDATLYSWVVGGYGNTCKPFRLENGAPFPGSDTACQVSIIGGGS